MSDSSGATMRSSRLQDEATISRLLHRHRRRTKRLLKRHHNQLQSNTRSIVAEEVQRAIAPLLYAPVVRGDDQGAQDEREELHRDVQYAIRGGSGGGGLSSGKDWPAAKSNNDLDSMEDMDLIVEVMTIRTRMRKARDVIRARRRRHEAQKKAAAGGSQARQNTAMSTTATPTSASQSHAPIASGSPLGVDDSTGPRFFGGRVRSSTTATAPPRTVAEPQPQRPPQLPGINSFLDNYYPPSTTAPKQDRPLAPLRESNAHTFHPRGNEATTTTTAASSTANPQQGGATTTDATTPPDDGRPRFYGTSSSLRHLGPFTMLTFESTRSAGESTPTNGAQESQSGWATL